MKILWISNQIFPDFAPALDQSKPTTGGWQFGMAKDLVNAGIELSVATVRPNIQDTQKTIDGIGYYLVQGKTSILHYDSSLEKKWKGIVNKLQPDVVHIHGTEYAHGLALVKACPHVKKVVSIQGLVGVISRYYRGQIPLLDILKNLTLRDILRQNSIWHAQRKFQKRGKLIEKKYLTLCSHFIGRTQWDHDHVISGNPKAIYHFCNESLRDAFYTAPKWQLHAIKKHTLFLSQALYPIKGLHKVLEALTLVKEVFPDIQVRVAGMDITKTQTLMDKIRLDNYGKYIKKQLKKLGLTQQVTFTGPLDAQGMVREYLACHAFVCPSSIENSPNSLGEAQLLGVPCIASYVGGVPDMVDHGETGLLYRFEETEMLAQHIIRLFQQDALAQALGENSIPVAQNRHDRKTNCETTLAIYKKIRDSE